MKLTEDEQKLADIRAAKAAARGRKHGKAGPHSSQKAKKGYNRKQKHKDKEDEC